MKWRNRKQSNHVDDRRNSSGHHAMGGGSMPSIRTIMMIWPLVKPLLRSKLGIAAIVVGGLAYFGGFIPSLSLNSGSSQLASTVNEEKDNELADFVKTVHGDTERVWQKIYAETGKKYQPATLVLYRGGTTSGCGSAKSGMGPFYCPTDKKVYVDLSFFSELKTKFGAGGDFAQAYVLAHEIGHHVQHLQGTLTKVHQAKQGATKREGNKLQVKVELQADCYAGLWANRAQKEFNMLEEGDFEEAITAANAIGDDKIQEKSQGFSVPHTFTHGSSKQRVEWFSKGFKSGKIATCNTFN